MWETNIQQKNLIILCNKISCDLKSFTIWNCIKNLVSGHDTNFCTPHSRIVSFVRLDFRSVCTEVEMKTENLGYEDHNQNHREKSIIYKQDNFKCKKRGFEKKKGFYRLISVTIVQRWWTFLFYHIPLSVTLKKKGFSLSPWILLLL